MTYCFGDISVWSRRILLNFCWVSIFFDILIANISWTVAQTPINHIIFWKTAIRTFRSICVNCFNRLRFQAEVSTKLQKMHFMDNLRVISQEGSMETRQMTPFFIYVFLKLYLAFIFIFQNGRNSFSCGHPFGLFWSVKYLNFGQKLPIRTTHHTFLESRHPEVTKNPYLWFVPRGEPKKGISSWNIIGRVILNCY